MLEKLARKLLLKVFSWKNLTESLLKKRSRNYSEYITVELENGIWFFRNRKLNKLTSKWKLENRIRKVLIEKKLKISTEVITAVWRNSWFCLSWKILRIFQFSFSKLFFLNCRWFAKRRNVITQFSLGNFNWNLV